jgi:hypothetical protein
VFVCFPLRCEWEASRNVGLVTHPAPEMVGEWSRECDLDIAEIGRRAGWNVRARYAVGTGIHGTTGRPTSLRESVAVRFDRPGWHAVAVRSRAARGGTWGWHSIWAWGSELPHRGLPLLADLRDWLQGGWGADGSWWDGLTERADAEVEQECARKLLKVLARGGMSVDDICRELGLELEIAEVRALVAPKRKKKEGAA